MEHLKGKLIDINTGRQHVRAHARPRHGRPVGVPNGAVFAGRRATRPLSRPAQAVAAISSIGVLGPLLFVAGVLGLLLVLRGNPDALEPLFVGFICIAGAFLGACKAAHDASSRMKAGH